MNPRQPMVTLTARESDRLRDLVTERGEKDAARAAGVADFRTILRAACRLPVSRLSAAVIRASLDRI